jgi:hypothetical protein
VRHGGPAWLVVNADDLGVTRGTTLGIIKAHREGIVTSASIAPAMPHYRYAVEQCAAQAPALGVGLHFTLTSGRPIADPKSVPLLVDEAGNFRWRFTSLMAALATGSPHGLVEQIDVELDAQFAQLKRDGIKTDHVNGERHVHLLPQIFERVVAAAERYGVAFVRAGSDFGPSLLRGSDVGALIGGGGVFKWALLSALTSSAQRRLRGRRHIVTANRVASYLYTGMTGAFLPTLLTATPEDGVTEVMVHPAMPGEDRDPSLGNRELERYVASPDRKAELDVLIKTKRHTGDWQLTTFGKLAAGGVS